MVQLLVFVFKLTKDQAQFQYFWTYTSFTTLPVDVGLVGSMQSSQSGGYIYLPTAAHA